MSIWLEPDGERQALQLDGIGRLHQARIDRDTGQRRFQLVGVVFEPWIAVADKLHRFARRVRAPQDGG